VFSIDRAFLSFSKSVSSFAKSSSHLYFEACYHYKQGFLKAFCPFKFSIPFSFYMLLVIGGGFGT
jgi:hypothetical protein